MLEGMYTRAHTPRPLRLTQTQTDDTEIDTDTDTRTHAHAPASMHARCARTPASHAFQIIWTNYSHCVLAQHYDVHTHTRAARNTSHTAADFAQDLLEQLETACVTIRRTKSIMERARADGKGPPHGNHPDRLRPAAELLEVGGCALSRVRTHPYA